MIPASDRIHVVVLMWTTKADFVRTRSVVMRRAIDSILGIPTNNKASTYVVIDGNRLRGFV